MLNLLFMMVGLTSPSSWAITPMTASDILTKKNITIPTTAKTTVITFLSAKCPCSDNHEPVLKTIYEKYHSKGIDFVGVHSNQDETDDQAIAHFKESAFPFPVVADKGAKIADHYNADGTPNVVIIHNGKIVFEGGMDDNPNSAKAKNHYLNDALNALVAGKPVPQAKAKSLGCAIKRKG